MLPHGTVQRANSVSGKNSVSILFQAIIVSKVKFALVHLVQFVYMEDTLQETSAYGQSLKREPSFSGVLGFVTYSLATHF